MTTITLSDFYDVDADVSCDDSEHEHHIDLGDLGDTYITIDLDNIVENSCFSVDVISVEVDLDDFAGELDVQGLVVEMLLSMVERIGINKTFSALAEIDEQIDEEDKDGV